LTNNNRSEISLDSGLHSFQFNTRHGNVDLALSELIREYLS